MNNVMSAAHHSQAAKHLRLAAQCHEQAASAAEQGNESQVLKHAHRAHAHTIYAVNHQQNATLHMVDPDFDEDD